MDSSPTSTVPRLVGEVIISGEHAVAKVRARARAQKQAVPAAVPAHFVRELGLSLLLRPLPVMN